MKDISSYSKKVLPKKCIALDDKKSFELILFAIKKPRSKYSGAF